MVFLVFQTFRSGCARAARGLGWDLPPRVLAMERGSTEWMTGVGLVVLGCACAATGLTLMKSSTIHEGEKPFCFRWRWLVGFSFLGILTTVIDVYVLGILPLSVVAPFAGLTIVFALLITGTGCLADAEPVSWNDLANALVEKSAAPCVVVWVCGEPTHPCHGSVHPGGGCADHPGSDARIGLRPRLVPWRHRAGDLAHGFESRAQTYPNPTPDLRSHPNFARRRS